MIEGVRAYQYPILEKGNRSFPGASYNPEFAQSRDPCSVMLTHRLGACPFLERLIAERQAVYCCVVSVPITGYRCLHIASENPQVLTWDKDELGEPPFFRPQIVAVCGVRCRLGEDDGVNPAWVGREVSIEKGARLGLGPYYRMASSSHRPLLKIERDRTYPEGTFTVDDCTNEGFYFLVKASEKLYRFLVEGSEAPLHRASIYTHIVSCCLECLRREYSGRDDDGDEIWRNHPNLVALATELERKEQPRWDDREFIAEKVAAALHPHITPQPGGSAEPDSPEN